MEQKKVQEIASMPTEHTWAARLMELDWQAAEKAENLVEKWIESQVERMGAGGETGRIVRRTWLPLLEHRAIDMWLDKEWERDPFWASNLGVPLLISPEQAVTWATEGEMWPIPEKEKEDARLLLERMESGELRPPVEEILAKSW